MKNIFKSIAFFVLIFNCCSGIAQIKREQLIGTWIFDYTVSISKMEEKAKMHYDKMQEISKNRFEKSFKGRKLNFNSDGSFLQNTSDGNSISGLWTLGRDNQSIIMTNQQGNILELKIINISASLLILIPVNTAKEQGMLLEWYFIKN